MRFHELIYFRVAAANTLNIMTEEITNNHAMILRIFAERD